MKGPIPTMTVSSAGADAKIGGRTWLVFAVSFGLLLSDYMSRQVLAAVFPLLKADWGLSDTQLGALGGVVALMVGLLTVPLSLVADRIGRARSVAIMAFTWSLATLACGFCANYGQLLAARLVLGVGEAAYGSVGLAVVFTYFPARLRATITSAFMAGGVFGSFAGLTLGGLVTAYIGWRGAFHVMAAFGLLLTFAYVLIVREDRRKGGEGAVQSMAGLGPRAIAAGLFGSKSLVLTYIASGLQLFVMGAAIAWTPSLLNRSYGLPPSKAAVAAAILLLSCGVGMVACGMLNDRLCAKRPALRSRLAAAFCVITFVFLQSAFLLPAGPLQIACAFLGLFCAAGATGPAGAAVADAAPRVLHGTALAVLTLANNLIGLAPGPALTGALADRLGLQAALQIATFAALFAAGFFWLSGRGGRRNP
jgi:MFS family permease